ncbi:hypothetical protein ACFL5V_05475 [Fibrobacterota bacterium]
MFKKILLTGTIAVAVFFLSACDDDTAGPGQPATSESILGRWSWTMLDVDATMDMSLPLFGIDTTLLIDTAVTPPAGSYIEFRSDGTYDIVTDTAQLNQIMEGAIGGYMMKSSAVNELVTITGNWWITGGLVYATQPNEEGTGVDTLAYTVIISGNNMTCMVDEQESQSQDGMSMSVDMRTTYTAVKDE